MERRKAIGLRNSFAKRSEVEGRGFICIGGSNLILAVGARML